MTTGAWSDGVGGPFRASRSISAQVTRAATGAVAQRIDYDAFGRVLADTKLDPVPAAKALGIALRPLDETLALPTERSARIALRTQQIIAYESGVIVSIDPLGGSYFLFHKYVTRGVLFGVVSAACFAGGIETGNGGFSV